MWDHLEISLYLNVFQCWFVFQLFGSMLLSWLQVELTDINLPEHKTVVVQTEQTWYPLPHGTWNHLYWFLLICFLLSSEVPFHCNRFMFPYPLQWGPPTFSAGHSFAMMSAVIVSMVEVSVFSLDIILWLFPLFFQSMWHSGWLQAHWQSFIAFTYMFYIHCLLFTCWNFQYFDGFSTVPWPCTSCCSQLLHTRRRLG